MASERWYMLTWTKLDGSEEWGARMRGASGLAALVDAGKRMLRQGRAKQAAVYTAPHGRPGSLEWVSDQYGAGRAS